MHDLRPTPPAARRRDATIAALLLGTALTAPVALAQDAGSYVVLDTITVLGTGLPTEVMHNPASITVVDEGEIRRIPPASIASLLRDVPGVQVGEEGIERISIRGENPRRVAIMIDGQKLTDHTGYGQPILVDPTTVERIEVVRGSSSVVSGSRAIGGVINIVTKRGADRPFALSASAGYFSATEGYRASTTLSGTQGPVDYRLSFGTSDMGDRRTPDGTLRPSDVQDDNVSGYVGFRQGNHYAGLRAERYDLAANVYTGMPDFSIELPRRDLRKVAAFYEGTDLTPWLRSVKADVYYQTIDRLFRNDVTVAAGPMLLNVDSASQDDQTTSGLNLAAEIDVMAGHRAVVGFEYEDDRLESDKTTNTTRTMMGMSNTTTSLRFDDASIRTSSVFAQYEIDLAPTLTATLGGRYYWVDADHDRSRTDGGDNPRSSASDNRGLGAAGLVWSPDETLALRANISQGYSYPTLGQLFLTTTGGGQTIVGNPDLDPETSTTFELGARVNRGGTLIDAALFYTEAEDYIATVFRGQTGTYENVDGATSYGLELLAQHDLGVWGLSPYASATLMRRELEYANGYTTYDSGSPELFGRVGLRKDWARGDLGGTLDLFLRGEGAAKMRDDAGAVVSEASGYGTLNLRADVAWRENLNVTMEIANILDKSYDPIDQMPGAERSFNIFATYRF